MEAIEFYNKRIREDSTIGSIRLMEEYYEFKKQDNLLAELKDSEPFQKLTSAKEVILDELNEQGHPEKVEDVIFWALEHYAKSEPKGTWGRTIAYAIKERILKVERDKS